MVLLSQEKVLFYSSKWLMSYKKGTLRIRETQTNRQIRKIAIGGWARKIQIVERVLRLEPKCVAQISEDAIILSLDGCIYYYNVVTDDFHIEHQYRNGMKNPVSFCVYSDEEESHVLYGEYIWNERHEPVAIYRRSENGWDMVYEFPAGSVTHIHNIVYDRFRNNFIILTGDSDEESGIWVADLSFKEVRKLFGGKQCYRACVLFPLEQALYYATDTPLEDNYIYKVPFDSQGELVEPQRCYKMPGPCIYGYIKDADMYFATSVEPDSSLPKWKYRVTYKLGNGVEDRFSKVIYGNSNGIFNELVALKKDFLPMWLFQFGNIQFPCNTTNKILITTQSLKIGHSKTFLLDEGERNV